jgi:hypothetical protein
MALFLLQTGKYYMFGLINKVGTAEFKRMADTIIATERHNKSSYAILKSELTD